MLLCVDGVWFGGGGLCLVVFCCVGVGGIVGRYLCGGGC